MSLTSFIKIPYVRDKFKVLFPKPQYTAENKLVAPPMTKNYSLVGTAFDYLLRFQLKYWYPDAISKGWIASKAPSLLKDNLTRNRAIKALEIGREQHDQFLQSGVITDNLLQACIVLAQLDVVFRRKAVVSDFLQVDESDLQDLKQLIKVVPRHAFDHQNLCLLDPTFGIGSMLVAGADVDLVIDDMIIDIKTTKKPTLQRQHFNQIIGYYMLYKISGVESAPKGHSIKQLSIYFSRFATLLTFDVQDILPEDKQNEFLPWFIEKAEAEFGTNLELLRNL